MYTSCVGDPSKYRTHLYIEDVVSLNEFYARKAVQVVIKHLMK
jgi:hypothetical protein